MSWALCYLCLLADNVQSKGEEVGEELLGIILLTKTAVKCEILGYDCCLRSLELDVFQWKKWGHLLQDGPGTKESFFQDSLVGTPIMWCHGLTLEKKFFSMYRYSKDKIRSYSRLLCNLLIGYPYPYIAHLQKWCLLHNCYAWIKWDI